MNTRRHLALDELGGIVLALCILVGSVTGSLSCKHWFTEQTAGRIVECGSQAIRDKGLLYIGRVNDIIGNPNLTDRDSKVRLGELGVQAGWDVLGCLLRDQQMKFADSSRRNPNDRMSATGARRAEEKLVELEAEGWHYTD